MLYWSENEKLYHSTIWYYCYSMIIFLWILCLWSFHLHQFSVKGLSSIIQVKDLSSRAPLTDMHSYIDHGAGVFMVILIISLCRGELDYLVVDMPPGTGDIQLTLCQVLLSFHMYFILLFPFWAYIKRSQQSHYKSQQDFHVWFG